MERARQLLRNLSKEARLIEVGPSYNPLAPKRDGWNTLIIDHADRETLVAKYSGAADVDTARIETVDFVWQGGSLADAVPEALHGTFDAVIASHVIEHTTDVVVFLKAAETLIHAEGVIVLAIPDKRKCFDFYRHPSTTADALAAFLEKRVRHDARTQFEYAMRTVSRGGQTGWPIDDSRDAVFSSSFERARETLALAERPEYVDAHNWVFVPSSFVLMITELVGMGYLDLRVEDITEVYATEFFAWLRKGRDVTTPADLQGRRKELMDLVILELSEQVRQISDSPAVLLRAEQQAQDRIDEERHRTDAVRTVLSAVLASIGWRGLDRKRFKALIVQAGQSVPETGAAPAQHQVLLDEARRVLGLKK